MLSQLLTTALCAGCVASGGAWGELVDTELKQAPVRGPHPGGGLVIMEALGKPLPEDAWFRPLTSVVYLRLEWAQLEPREGAYRFDEILGPQIERWTRRGVRFGLRVMSSDAHSTRSEVTPAWVFEAGVPAVHLPGIEVQAQRDPVFWHPLYIEKQLGFVRALAAWLRTRGLDEKLAFVDIGSMGEWGESHLKRWSEATRLAQGHTRDAFTRAYLAILEGWRLAMPDATLLFNAVTDGAGDDTTLIARAVKLGIGLRHDGLHAEMPEMPWMAQAARVPTAYELRDPPGRASAAAVERGLRDPLTWLTPGWGHRLLRAPKALRTMLSDAAGRVGCRPTLLRVRHPESLRAAAGARPALWLDSEWENRGSGHCHTQLEAQLWLEEPAGAIRALGGLLLPPPNRFAPGARVTVPLAARLPASVAAGTHRLRVSLHRAGEPAQRWPLGLAQCDAAQRCVAGSWRIERGGDLGAAAAARDAQLRDTGAWWLAEGISRKGTNDELRLSGRAVKGWNYAGSGRLPLAPLSTFELTAELRVDALKPSAAAPRITVSLLDGAGEWMRAVHTAPVSGRDWQRVSVRFRSGPRVRFAEVSVDRAAAVSASANLRLRGLSLRRVD